MDVAKLLLIMTTLSVFCGIWFLTGTHIGIFLATVIVCGYLIMTMNSIPRSDEGWLDGIDTQPVHVFAQTGKGGGIMCFHMHNLVYMDKNFTLDNVDYTLSPDINAMLKNRAFVFERPYSSKYSHHFLMTRFNKVEASKLPRMFSESPVIFLYNDSAKRTVPKLVGLRQNTISGLYETVNGDYIYNVEAGTCSRAFGFDEPGVSVHNHLVPQDNFDAKPTVK